MSDRRGLPSIPRRYMQHADVQRQIVESMERPRPEHDTSGARLLRGAMEKEVGL